MTTYSTLKEKFISRGQSVYWQTDNLLGGSLTIIIKTVEGFAKAKAMESAASMAYYALFSFFPLLIFVVGSASSLLKDEPVQQMVLEAVEQYLPIALDLVKGNIEHAISTSSAVQIVGTIGLLWAATGVFTALTHSIDRAWHTARERNFVFKRLMALAMIASLTGLLIVWILFTTVFNLLPWFEIPIFGDLNIYQSYAWNLASQTIPGFVIFIMFVNLYRWVPNTKVRWREAAAGAVFATWGWEIVNSGLGWYLGSAWARYQLIYGSLGTAVALLLWVYISSAVVLFGAHLSANIALHTRLKHLVE